MRLVPRLLCILIVSGAGVAEGRVGGATFLADCYEASEPVQKAECIGYIKGVVDALNSNIAKGMRACIPAGTSDEEIWAAVQDWLRANGKVLHRMRGFGLVGAALVKSYPCAGK